MGVSDGWWLSLQSSHSGVSSKPSPERVRRSEWVRVSGTRTYSSFVFLPKQSRFLESGRDGTFGTSWRLSISCEFLPSGVGDSFPAPLLSS